MDWILFEVSKLVDDKTDFDEALEKFQKEKPQYFSNDNDDGDDDSNKNFRSSSQKKRTNNKKTDADSWLDKRYKNSPYRR